ncbi:MAG TPA: histidine phosphatase family protein [Candidatus Binatia bacterium]|nr:histidine phosphatase family protein [Candidatus Binatia bacterium]
MATTLTLIAHASTAAARHATFPGDEPLDAFGLRDCARVKLNFSTARVWIAPELRTRQTAEALGLAGENAPSLRDGDYGTWAGKRLAALAPDALQLWLSDPEAAPHGGESHAAALRRIGAWLDAQGGTQERILAVVHPLVLRAAIAHVLGAGAAVLQRIDAPPLSAATFSWSNRWRFRGLAPAGADTRID